MNKTKSTYSEKLRDPRWQRKRLEVMQRDDFKCRMCGATDKTLNVHHCYYSLDRTRMPWEYELESLKTLCEECHECETENLPRGKELLIGTIGRFGLGSSEMYHIAKILYRAGDMGLIDDPREFMRMFLWAFETNDMWSFIKKIYDEALGGKTNSDASEENVPTGEGSSAGDTVERKSDA